MNSISESVRRVTTFVLAAFLWVHALFLWHIDSIFIAKHIQFLHLSTTEFGLFALLLIFTCVSGSGFWKPLRSLAYIYFFPFVVLALCFYALFLVLRALHKWLAAPAKPEPIADTVLEQSVSPTTDATEETKVGFWERFSEALKFLVRPFRRFTFLWCILLLVTTHVMIMWLCLVLVLVQLARKVFFILRICFFSGPALSRFGTAMLRVLDQPLATLDAVTGDAAPTNEMKNLWNQFKMWRKILDFLRDPYLLSRWAWIIGIVFVGSVYLYFSVLFSFVYYGLARVSGVHYSWTDALISSVFIPFAYSDLPRILPIRLLSYFHAALVVAVGIGTIVNFLQRRLESVRKAAMELSERLAEPAVQSRLQILEVRVGDPAPPATPSAHEAKANS